MGLTKVYRVYKDGQDVQEYMGFTNVYRVYKDGQDVQ